MHRKVMVITNNETVALQKHDQFLQGTLLDVLKHCRSLVQRGHLLISHPLASSLKPNETPYKSVVLSQEQKEQIDLQSLKIIENAVRVAENMLKDHPLPSYSQKILVEYQFMDKDLLQTALNSL